MNGDSDAVCASLFVDVFRYRRKWEDQNRKNCVKGIGGWGGGVDTGWVYLYNGILDRKADLPTGNPDHDIIECEKNAGKTDCN